MRSRWARCLAFLREWWDVIAFAASPFLSGLGWMATNAWETPPERWGLGAWSMFVASGVALGGGIVGLVQRFAGRDRHATWDWAGALWSVTEQPRHRRVLLRVGPICKTHKRAFMVRKTDSWAWGYAYNCPECKGNAVGDWRWTAEQVARDMTAQYALGNTHRAKGAP
jgi:hypothetical protein